MLLDHFSTKSYFLMFQWQEGLLGWGNCVLYCRNPSLRDWVLIEMMNYEDDSLVWLVQTDAMTLYILYIVFLLHNRIMLLLVSLDTVYCAFRSQRPSHCLCLSLSSGVKKGWHLMLMLLQILVQIKIMLIYFLLLATFSERPYNHHTMCLVVMWTSHTAAPLSQNHLNITYGEKKIFKKAPRSHACS